MMPLSTTETVTRPAAAALDAWFPAPGTAQAGAGRDALIEERAEVTVAIAATVGRMGVEQDSDVLDDLTEEVVGLLARAEEIRLALALAARAADETWLLALDLD